MPEHERSNDGATKTIARRRSEVLESTESILRRRSRELAERELEAATPEIHAEVITVRRDSLRLGFPVGDAQEVRRVGVTVIPGSTDIVNGVFQIRGKVLSLIDLAPFANEATTLAHGDQTLVIVIGSGEKRLGVRIDEVVGQQTILSGEVDDEFHRIALPFVNSVTRDLIHVIDTEALLQTPEILLSQTSTEVGGM